MISPVEVSRDEHGFWTHPALLRSSCQTTPQLIWWLREQKLECFVMSMRDEATDAFCAAWDDGPPDASTWELVSPRELAGFWGRFIIPTMAHSATGSAPFTQPGKAPPGRITA